MEKQEDTHKKDRQGQDYRGIQDMLHYHMVDSTAHTQALLYSSHYYYCCFVCYSAVSLQTFEDFPQ